jgi:hypothetical protein
MGPRLIIGQLLPVVFGVIRIQFFHELAIEEHKLALLLLSEAIVRGF